MKKIFVQLSAPIYANNNIFTKMDGNNLNAGWFAMREKLGQMGYELSTADDRSLNDCEGIIFFSADSVCLPLKLSKKLNNILRRIMGKKINRPYPSRNLYEEAIALGMRDKLVLVLWEPKTVLPANFNPRTWAKFDHIVTWDDDLVDGKKFIKYYHPMEGNKVLEKAVPFKEKKLLVSISINKFSTYKYELYSARRNTCAYFEKHYSNDFDFFGLRWNQPVTFWQKIFPFLVQKFSSYRGHAGNKLEVLSRYKFNLVYENTSDAKGYVCDKVFTSFHARSVPIYWGASNVEEYIDTDAFIDRRKFKNDVELAEFITNITEAEYNRYLEAGARYMQSEKYTKCLPENFVNPFIEALKLKSNK